MKLELERIQTLSTEGQVERVKAAEREELLVAKSDLWGYSRSSTSAASAGFEPATSTNEAAPEPSAVHERPQLAEQASLSSLV